LRLAGHILHEDVTAKEIAPRTRRIARENYSKISKIARRPRPA